MPLVRVSLRRGKPSTYLQAIGESVHQAMVATINVPPEDRFQVITQHPPEELICDRQYLGIQRSPDAIVVQITLNSGRTVEMKRALYKAIAENLSKNPGLRKEDVLVNLVEVAKENWSFGNGQMSYPP
ncbi:MAG TPA: tautomerase family protein [Thermoanaerobaculia bacterium]|nr:tautomerase family protein [Thermoanaerobaculia bacterium]